MKKQYQHQNVYEAFCSRMHYIFREFDNIYVSFSGGKDSGLLLNLTLDFRNKFYPGRTVGVFHQDFEAQYSETTKYVENTFNRIEKEAELYWVCLPMATRTSISNYEMFWYPWDDKKEADWVRPMPDHPYVINLKNNPFVTYRYRMHQEDLANQFGRFYRMTHENKKTICLLGIRCDESLHRYSAIINAKYGYKGQSWIIQRHKDVWAASPLYDWSTSDVWHANAIFGYEYNHLYDLYYMAGVRPDQMRVASPFNDYAKESLNLYRIIDPEIWVKLVGRVRGVNSVALYGKTKALGYRKVTLPKNYTWKEYTLFLLETLPAKLRNNYIRKFRTSIDFWHRTGGGLPTDVVNELVARGYDIRLNGVSNYTVMKNPRVVFVGRIPDDTDDIKSTKDIPSWKRMCACILKNDHICRTMGFSLTREQQLRVKILKEKYEAIEEDEK